MVTSMMAMVAAVVVMTATPVAAACRLARVGSEPGVALVMAGGGAKGAWEAGVARALVDAGVPLRLVAGTSAGALTAAMLADGRLDRLEAVWTTVTREQVYFLRPSVALAGLLPGWLTLVALDGAGALLDAAPLRALVTEALDLERVRRSPLRVLVSVTDLARGEPRLFDNASVTVDALMAAAAVPGVFAPVALDGGVLVDGGLVGRAPVLEALGAGVPVGRLLVLSSYGPRDGTAGERLRPPTMRRVLEEAFELMMVHQIARDAELAAHRRPDVDVVLLSPSAPLDLRPLDFEPAALARAFGLGRADGRACVTGLTGG